VDPSRAQRTFSGANQGSLVIAFRIDLFTSPAQFKQEMDEYVRQVKQLQPLAGFSESHLPGGIEAARQKQHEQEGVPMGVVHRQRLEELAKELSIPIPWSRSA
jgi:L-2-hydroxycarboxylate dehydrogenase (NAD+)